MNIRDILKSEDISYWYFGLMLFSIFIVSLQYYMSATWAQEIEKRMPYETVYRLMTILIFALGMMYISRPLSKLIAVRIANNPTFQKWYSEYQARQWRKNK